MGWIEELFKQGAINESEVYQARLNFLRAELVLQQVMLRIEQLQSAGGDPPPM